MRRKITARLPIASYMKYCSKFPFPPGAVRHPCPNIGSVEVDSRKKHTELFGHLLHMVVSLRAYLNDVNEKNRGHSECTGKVVMRHPNNLQIRTGQQLINTFNNFFVLGS